MTLNEIMNSLLNAVLLASVPFLVAFVKLGLDELLKYLRSKISEQNLATAVKLAAVAVQAAEQAGITAAVVNDVVDKKVLAVRYLNESLNTHGIELEFNQIEALIEAEVLKQFNMAKLAK